MIFTGTYFHLELKKKFPLAEGMPSVTISITSLPMFLF